MSQHARNHPEECAMRVYADLVGTLPAISDGDCDEDGCDKCGASAMVGCIHYSGCCGAPIIACTDFCSACKEHTSIENI